MNTLTHLIFATLVLSFTAYAQEDREVFREAMDSCVSETGVARPSRGARPSEEDQAKIDACLSSKGITKLERPGRGFREAMESCLAENGDDERIKIQSCLEGKGFTRPSRGSRQ